MIPPPTPSMSHTENRYMFRIWQQFKEKKLMQIKVHKEVEMHREKMAIFKTILMFVWLLTGYFCNSEDLDEEATGSPIVTSAFKKVIKASESEPPQNGIYHASEKHPLPLIVAGISISLVLLFILVIIGVWYAWKKSKESLAEANSVPSVESGVSLKRISTYEDQ